MLRILHVASFNGNIGDALSHIGLYKLLDTDLGISRDDIYQLDLRRFYKNASVDALQFNSDCAADFNKYDLIIIGGGGFLRQAFEKSISGNTFDFEDSFLSKLQSKILFYSIGGINSFEAVTEQAYSKTERFIEKLYADPRFKFLFRTDGSVHNSQFLKALVDKEPSSVVQIFDSAYLNRKQTGSRRRNSVIINIGYDQALESSCGLNEVIVRTSQIIARLYKEDPSIVFEFVPHTYYDVEAFSALCKSLPERIKRNNLKCLQSFTFYSDLQNTINAYASARLALTGRFHSTAFAFLYTGNFLPLYEFDRTKSQLDALGLTELQVATPKEAVKAFNNDTITQKISNKYDERQILNRATAGEQLKQFLGQ
jgi:hypothetical protein